MELCGWFWRLVLRIRPLEWVVRLLTKPMAPISMCVLMRARYAEQTLEQAVEDGVYAVCHCRSGDGFVSPSVGLT